MVDCAKQNRLEIARLLLEYGADTEVQDSCDDTALSWAYMSGNWALMRLLLDHGAKMRTFRGTYFAVPPEIEEYMMKYSFLSAQSREDSTDAPPG